MAKRKKTKSNPSNPSVPKRPKPSPSDYPDTSQRGYIDATTGQRGAFPGLSACDTDFYGPANDGLSYLRMVRSEARLVPSLLLSDAAHPAPLKTGEHESVFFEESTLVSLTPAPARKPLPIFHAPLLKRFRAWRERLHSGLPVREAGVSVAGKIGERWVRETAPTLRVLWALDQHACLQVFGVLKWMLANGKGAQRRVGEWAWACLVRVDEVMTGEEVVVVREVGKAALTLRRTLATMEGRRKAKQEEEDEESEAEEGEEVEEKVQIDTVEVEGALDMIISVIGDFFGQRDLLEERAAFLSPEIVGK